jgi:hypothetical protein
VAAVATVMIAATVSYLLQHALTSTDKNLEFCELDGFISVCRILLDNSVNTAKHTDVYRAETVCPLPA